MPYKIEWCIENRVIWMHVSGNVTPVEPPQMAGLIKELQIERDTRLARGEIENLPMHLLVDATRLEHLLVSLTSAITFGEAIQKHPDYGHMAVYGAINNRMLATLMMLAAKVANIRCTLVQNYEEAMQLLTEVDSLLEVEV